MQKDDRNQGVTPTRAEAGVMTAPTLTAADEIEELRQEVVRLKAQLAQTDQGAVSNDIPWPTKITYGGVPLSGARLGGLTNDRDSILPTTDVPGLPEPTTDEGQLEADFVRWGYCIVKNALTPEQVQTQVDRLQDQAAAERAA